MTCENLDGQCGKSWCNCAEVRARRIPWAWTTDKRRDYWSLAGYSRVGAIQKTADFPPARIASLREMTDAERDEFDGGRIVDHAKIERITQ